MDERWTDETVLAELGRRLKALRLERNETQSALADRAGVSRATVVRAEQGRSITMTAMVRLARALGLFEGLDAFVPAPAPSPLAELRGQRRRRRASPPRDGNGGGGGLPWGTT